MDNGGLLGISSRRYNAKSLLGGLRGLLPQAAAMPFWVAAAKIQIEQDSPPRNSREQSLELHFFKQLFF